MGVLDLVSDALTFAGGSTIPNPITVLREIYPLEIGGYVFTYGALIQVKGKKNIVVTEIPGGSGTQKELVSVSDYEITVTGKIYCKTNTALREEVANLIALWDKPEALPIISPYTEMFGIKKIVIQSFDPMIKDGYQSCLWYTFTGMSDNEITRKTEIKQSRFAKLKALVKTYV
jgi:hypothetical protein